MPSTTTARENTIEHRNTSAELLVCAMLQLALVCVAYRMDKKDKPSLIMISTPTCAIFLGLVQAHSAGLDPPILFFGLLPPIILEAGFNTQRKGFFSNFWTILLLAVGGTIVATFVTGFILTWLGKWGIITPLSAAEALLYGSLVSAVDPVATLVVLKKSHVPSLLLNLVFGESVLNDAVAIVLFQLFQRVVQRGGADINLETALTLGLQLVGIFVGSILLSGLICYSSAYCLRHADVALKHHPTYEIAIILLSAYASYVAADLSDLSGLLAVFFSGVFIRHYHMYTISKASAFAFKHLLDTLAFLAENFIYLYLGLSVVAYNDVFAWDWGFIAVSFVVCLLSRAVNTFPLCIIANCFRGKAYRIPKRYMLVIWFSGLRGAIAFALALNVTTPSDPSHAAMLKSSTLFTVLFTTVVFGTGTGPLLSLLNLRDMSGHERLTADTSVAAGTTATVMPSNLESLTLAEEERQPLLRVDTVPNMLKQPWYRTWSVHDAWIALDEKYLKPMFGGNPRPTANGESSTEHMLNTSDTLIANP